MAIAAHSRREALALSRSNRVEIQNLRQNAAALRTHLKAGRKQILAACREHRAKLAAELRRLRAELAQHANRERARIKAECKRDLAELRSTYFEKSERIKHEIAIKRRERSELAALAEKLKTSRGRAAGRRLSELESEKLDALLHNAGISRGDTAGRKLATGFLRKHLKRDARATPEEQFAEWLAERPDVVFEKYDREADAWQKQVERAHDVLADAHERLEKTAEDVFVCATPEHVSQFDELRAAIAEMPPGPPDFTEDAAGRYARQIARLKEEAEQVISAVRADCSAAPLKQSRWGERRADKVRGDVPRPRKRGTGGRLAIAGKRHRTARATAKPPKPVKAPKPAKAPKAPKAPKAAKVPKTLTPKILAILKRQPQTRLAELRAALPGAPWPQVLEAVRALNVDRKIHLYREDNNAALTAADRAAEVLVGGEPRHIIIPAGKTKRPPPITQALLKKYTREVLEPPFQTVYMSRIFNRAGAENIEGFKKAIRAALESGAAYVEPGRRLADMTATERALSWEFAPGQYADRFGYMRPPAARAPASAPKRGAPSPYNRLTVTPAKTKAQKERKARWAELVWSAFNATEHEDRTNRPMRDRVEKRSGLTPQQFTDGLDHLLQSGKLRETLNDYNKVILTAIQP